MTLCRLAKWPDCRQRKLADRTLVLNCQVIVLESIVCPRVLPFNEFGRGNFACVTNFTPARPFICVQHVIIDDQRAHDSRYYLYRPHTCTIDRNRTQKIVTEFNHHAIVRATKINVVNKL